MSAGGPARVIIQCAMGEEADPFLEALQGAQDFALLGDTYSGPSRFVAGILEEAPALVVTSGIGTTNAAVAASAAIRAFQPQAVIVAGTTGGLGEGIAAGDLVVADKVLYHEADAAVFGYAPGQVPQMPPLYEADPVLVAGASAPVGAKLWRGLVGSSNSFVTGDTAANVRAAFPALLAVDMETAAVAQTCWMFGIPWVSLRAVSDLCDPDAAPQFRAHAPEASQTSYETVAALIREATTEETHDIR